MQTYQTKSGGGYFFAGLLFALVLGGGGYWMLHKEKLSAAICLSLRERLDGFLSKRLKALSNETSSPPTSSRLKF